VSRSDRPVFDAAALLAIIQGEPGMERLLPLCDEAAVSAVTLAEVQAKLVSNGMLPNEAQAACDALHLEALPFEPAHAALSARYVQKNVSLGDRCFLATAFLHGTGWTADRQLTAIKSANAPSIKLFRQAKRS
jgi:PIN domain nuclease of toxin-antitoxin system